MHILLTTGRAGLLAGSLWWIIDHGRGTANIPREIHWWVGGNMKLGKRGCIVLLATLLVVPAFAQEPKAVDRPEELGFAGDRLERVTKAFQGYVDNGLLPGAVVLIARNDNVVYLNAFGYRDRDRKVAMTTDTIFRIASMTKPRIEPLSSSCAPKVPILIRRQLV
jgi:hypothetical protein